MTDGLDAVREVATHWRRRYQAAQALLAETQRERDTAKDALFVVTSIKNRALDERDDARRWSAAWKAAAKNNREYAGCLADQSEAYWREWQGAIKRYEHIAAERDELAAGIKRRDAIIANLRTAAGGLPKSNTALPGAGLLGPYTPTADHFSLLVGKDKGGQWTAEMRDIPDTPPGIDPLGSWTGESWQLDDEDE